MKRKAIGMMGFLVASTLLLSSCGTSSSTTVKPAGGDLSGHKTEVIKATDMSKNPATAKNRKDTMVIGIDPPDGLFNPLYNESAYDVYVTETMFDGLFSIDGEGQPIPGIAKKWDISSDGLKYTFHMRDDVKFSDGNPVTADDVAFTYTVPADKSYDGVGVDMGSLGIKGWEDYNSGKATSIEGIKVVDKNTIEFTLETPNSNAIYSFGAGILEKAYYGKNYKQGDQSTIVALNHAPIGCGQYKFKSYKEGQEVDLVANDTYWNGKPKIANIIYKATTEDTRLPQLKAGETDIDFPTVNPENVDQLKQAGFIELQICPTNGYGYIGLNMKNPIFADQKVRQALAIGLDRKSVVNAVYKGYADVCNEPQSKVSKFFTNDVNKYEFNTDTANKMLDEAGWKKGSDGIREKDGVKMTIHFAASTPNPVNDALIPIAQADYQKLGIKFIPEQMDFNAVRAKQKKGDFDMFFMAWNLTGNPDDSAIYTTKGVNNKTFYSNATVDKLFADANKETNDAKKKTIYQNIYKEINKDLPYIYMYQRRDMWAINGRIQGISTTPYRDFTYDLYKATIK